MSEIVKRKIACLAWFPTESLPFPKLCKIEDEDGEIQLIKDIIINGMESIRDGLYQINEYKCQAIVGKQIRKFKIVYYNKTSEWFIFI
ncbi:MAG: hypothetical protein HFG65_12925 [Hungatella sp.]|nr:hypothetical protein [Hungatella sp.]